MNTSIYHARGVWLWKYKLRTAFYSSLQSSPRILRDSSNTTATSVAWFPNSKRNSLKCLSFGKSFLSWRSIKWGKERNGTLLRVNSCFRAQNHSAQNQINVPVFTQTLIVIHINVIASYLLTKLLKMIYEELLPAQATTKKWHSCWQWFVLVKHSSVKQSSKPWGFS